MRRTVTPVIPMLLLTSLPLACAKGDRSDSARADSAAADTAAPVTRPATTPPGTPSTMPAPDSGGARPAPEAPATPARPRLGDKPDLRPQRDTRTPSDTALKKPKRPPR